MDKILMHEDLKKAGNSREEFFEFLSRFSIRVAGYLDACDKARIQEEAEAAAAATTPDGLENAMAKQFRAVTIAFGEKRLSIVKEEQRIRKEMEQFVEDQKIAYDQKIEEIEGSVKAAEEKAKDIIKKMEKDRQDCERFFTDDMMRYMPSDDRSLTHQWQVYAIGSVEDLLELERREKKLLEEFQQEKVVVDSTPKNNNIFAGKSRSESIRKMYGISYQVAAIYKRIESELTNMRTSIRQNNQTSIADAKKHFEEITLHNEQLIKEQIQEARAKETEYRAEYAAQLKDLMAGMKIVETPAEIFQKEMEEEFPMEKVENLYSNMRSGMAMGLGDAKIPHTKWDFASAGGDSARELLENRYLCMFTADGKKESADFAQFSVPCTLFI